MTSRSAVAHARAAGILALLMGPPAAFALVFVPGKLIVAGNPEATAHNIAASEGLLRMAFVSHLVVLLLDVTLAVLLYWLLKPVHAALSMLAATCRLTMAAIRGATLVTLLVALLLLGGSQALQSFPAEPSQALALLCFEAFAQALQVDLTFFAVHLMLVGWLVYKSGFLPRVVGVLLAIGGVGYLVDALATFVAPHAGVSVSAYLGWGELALALWLVIRGVNAPAWDRAVAAAAGPGPGPAAP